MIQQNKKMKTKNFINIIKNKLKVNKTFNSFTTHQIATL